MMGSRDARASAVGKFHNSGAAYNDLWQVTEKDLDSIAIGAGILGTGGGGNPYIGQLRARQAIRQWGPVTVRRLKNCRTMLV